MALSTDLMGLSMPPYLASRLANGGNGPVTTSLANFGNTYSTAYQIKNDQFLIYIPAGGGAGGLALPTIGSDAGAFIADDYIIVNGASITVSIYPPSTVSIVGAGTSGAAGSSVTVASDTVVSFWSGPNTTTWLYR